MIDKENEIYSRVKSYLEEKLGKDTFQMASIYVDRPAKFPFIFAEMAGTFSFGNDQSSRENYAEIMYEFNIYGNKSPGRKQEVKTIAGYIDEMMRFMNFNRIAYVRNDNPSEGTVYTNDTHDENIIRLILRYEGVASDTHFYRR